MGAKRKGRPKGSAARKKENSQKTLRFMEETMRPSACEVCGRIPIRGHVLLPGFYDWVRTATADLAGLRRMIAATGWLCRSCLAKRSGVGRPRAKGDGWQPVHPKPLVVLGVPTAADLEEEVRTRYRQRALDVRLEELGATLG